MDSVSFEEFSNHFNTKLNGLRTVLDLRDAAEDDTCITQLQMLKTELSSVQSILISLKNQQELREKKMTELKEMNENVSGTIKRLSYTVNNIPSRLPKTNKSSQDESTASSPTSASNRHSTTSNTATVSASNTATVSASLTRNKSGSSIQSQNGNARLTVKQENVYYPELEFLTTEEFDQIPKYLKGRLSYDQVNKFLESMNKTYLAKYKLLKQKKSSLNDANRKRFETYRSQENKETQGCYFIVDEDMKEIGGLKIDNVARSILTILRHCGRCREVRGGRITRYVYVESY